jgi:phosphatidylglycerophosphate synthase
MLFYDMTMTEKLPEWTYLFVAFGIFAFQTLDAIDGKQARRTGSSSPLGQLFDHGCDAISWTI